jgi:hypothetical protein
MPTTRRTRSRSALCTPDAEIEDEDAEVTRGRDAIVARFAETLAGSEAGALAVNTESLRFLGTDLAIEEGTASLTFGVVAPPQTNRYSVIYARQGGRWLHARISDEHPNEVSSHEQLVQLESFWCQEWSGFFLALLSGILGVVVGLMLLGNPIQGAITLTILLASFLFVGGIFEA